MLLVFFFKQKTAYEMRISDWSSDVCSSDLPGAQRAELRQEPPTHALRRMARNHMADLMAHDTSHLGLVFRQRNQAAGDVDVAARQREGIDDRAVQQGDRKSTRLNSSH